VDNLGLFNRAHGADTFGFRNLKRVRWNLGAPALYEHAIAANEAQIVHGGALLADTGVHTGRSPKDKFTVRDATTENTVWWDNNKAMSREHFDTLLADFIAHAEGKELFAQDLYGGADPNYRIKARVYTELAWHSLFIRNLLIRPEVSELTSYIPDMTVVDLPSFKADPARHGCRTETVIACDFTRRIVLIGGTSYAGEMKKSVFTFLNFILPGLKVLPMHCSANLGERGDVALFFGLSGTGKTTLSADPNRTLDRRRRARLGPRRRVQLRGRLLRQDHPPVPRGRARDLRHHGALRHGAGKRDRGSFTRLPDFDDESRTENTRCAYPLDFISNASPTGRAGMPKNIVMLTADAFGVMPPIAKLTPAEAMYHFLSGYTAKVAGTEKGLVGVEPEFSTCFASPFLPQHPSVYGNLLRDLIAKHSVDCWLVNTGWTGGGYGTGRRMPIRVTRRLLSAALDGSLNRADFRRDPYFGFAVPTSVPGVEPHILYPVKTWQDKAAFAETAKRLVGMFEQNFKQFEPYVDADVRAAAPQMSIAA
jgi:phosphoenolpyruvate carboxykinase (ATP)